ncbi:MAG: proline dehydrogenase family protein [Propionibacteriaceae bacterium]|jgi:proline dehydrogenase|nr:proline dehydrogenase family protein [Propionibacteriaceae bacterium]
MIRKLLLALSRNLKLRDLLRRLPGTRAVVRRFVAGETWDEAQPQVKALVERGLKVTVDLLGEDTTDADQAEQVVADYLELLNSLEREGLAAAVEVSLKPTAIGLGLPEGVALALGHATTIAQRAAAIGSAVTIDMEGHTTTEATVRLVEALRQVVPGVGCALQANLKRTEFDCARLDGPQSRTRLCKGAYNAPAEVAYTDRHDVNLSYVRCLKVLMRGEGLPLIATHNPSLIEIAQEVASRTGRGLKDLEFQMLYGVRALEQERLSNLGYTVRVYVPFGVDWYGYLVRRLAERPANLSFFLRSLVGHK